MRPFGPAWWKQERAAVRQRWWLWPVVVVFALYGLGGLAWCVYKGWWFGVAFTLAWLVGLAFLMGPSKQGWDDRRRQRMR